ncbi:uncharacterized protein LOC133183133 [Saccostrea echinata]|uniref:uncharacterized protein LOC133183133 n=1 Tax=Saccostrea echinata TaxID=191078 RepID=UPI002A80DE6D|nr:uncharacterized protein LOC133183133 [Saccostrea echinata]
MATKSTKKSKPQLIKSTATDSKQKTTLPVQHEDETNFLLGLYDEQLKKSGVEIEDLNKKIESLSTENVFLKDELQKFKDYKLERYEEKVEDLESKVTELERQLTLAKEGQTENADLSKGPKKINFATKFSELYDIIWKDALKEQIDNEGKSEEDGISFLLTILKDANVFSSTQVIEFQNSMSPFTAGRGIPNEKNLPPGVVQQFKDIAKNIYNSMKEPLSHIFVGKFLHSQKTSGKTFGKATTMYAGACAIFCWFKCFEDPPLYMDVSIPNGKFDTEKYRAYKNTGTEYRYLVWPCLYLHKDGPMLVKGVAQGK